MAHSINRRYRYGSSFVDVESGLRFEGHHPAERPDLWRLYLDGAEGKYRSFGFEETLHRRDLEAGQGVSLFFLAFDAQNKVVGGMRVHGPLENRHQAAIMGEMAASSDIEEIGESIDREARLGAIEIKGAWSEGEAATGYRLLVVFSRSVVHALNWLGAEFAIAAVADRMLPVGEVTGAIRIGTTSVAFPDERYRTVAVSYRRTLSYELSSPENQFALRREAEQLSRGPAVAAGAEGEDTVQYHAWQPLVLDVTARGPREVLRVLREESDLQQSAVKSARETVTLTLNQYKAGTVSYLNVVTVQATALTNERTQLSIVGRQLGGSVGLIRGLGGGWDPAAAPPPAPPGR